MIKLTIADRAKHVYVAGMTGMGKSTLIHHMVYQDIKNGSGVCVIDPKGDLVNQLIHWIPENRVEDTIYLDLETPIPIDFMSYNTPDEKEVLVGDLIYIIERHTEGAPRMTSILRDLIYTLLDAGGCSFLDMYYFLWNKTARMKILTRVKDQDLKQRWTDRFPTPKEIDPIYSRMTMFLRTPSLKTIFGTKKPKLVVEDAMNSRKILLVNLGGVGESRSFYGSLLVSKIQQAAFRRHRVAENKRIPFLLYVDEFQNFQTSSFDHILSMARGYKLYLTLANQGTYQLDERIRKAIFANVSNYIVFRIGDEDTKHFRAIAKPNHHEMLASLPQYHALFKIGGQYALVKRIQPPAPFKEKSFAEIIRKRTIKLYSCVPPTDALASKEDLIPPSAPLRRPNGQTNRASKTCSKADR